MGILLTHLLCQDFHVNPDLVSLCIRHSSLSEFSRVPAPLLLHHLLVGQVKQLPVPETGMVGS